MHYHIKDHQWETIYSALQQESNIHTKDKAQVRIFVEAVWYIVRSGCQWRLLPREYGCWRAVHKRFRSWALKGIWDSLFQSVQSCPDMEVTMIDTTMIRAHACSSGYHKDSQAEEALGRSRGGFTTKIHAVVDALGNPLKFALTAGQRHDISQASALMADFVSSTVIADKGYDCNTFIASLESSGSQVVIPPRSNRKVQREYDTYLYKERHLIECFFGKIKHFRRIFSRFDKSAYTFLAFLHFVGILIWLS